MTTYNHLALTSALSLAQFNSQCDVSMGGLPAMNNFQDFVSGLIGGNQAALCTFTFGRIQAVGTLTFVSVIATNTILINGVTFTCVASGATGNQFNVGGTDTLTAVAAAAAINASVTALVSGYVTATSALGVVTITAVASGLPGNGFTISSPNGTITASGARLTGGTNGTTTTVDLS